MRSEKKAQRLGRTDRMPVCCIIPPHQLESIAENGDAASRLKAEETLRTTAQLMGQREAFMMMGNWELMAGGRQRATYDALTFTRLPGISKRKEEDVNPCGQPDADEAHDGAASVYELFSKVFQRDSLDGKGQRLVSTVNYGRNYSNAFWNGRQLVYGQGDGELFGRFTASLSVLGHEFVHGVVQNTCNLVYQGQPGALNESFADIFGLMVDHYVTKTPATPDRNSWVIGRGLLLPGVKGSGIRNMLEPGTAYDDPVLGRDPQPADMDHYIQTTQDNGGTHLNSSIPNRAFAIAACKIGGYSWERIGKIWYRCLTKYLTRDSGFTDCAEGTILAAREMYGPNSREEEAVEEGWQAVKVPYAVSKFC
jgi:Zn-dependent metalloprotease